MQGGTNKQHMARLNQTGDSIDLKSRAEYKACIPASIQPRIFCTRSSWKPYNARLRTNHSVLHFLKVGIFRLAMAYVRLVSVNLSAKPALFNDAFRSFSHPCLHDDVRHCCVNTHQYWRQYRQHYNRQMMLHWPNTGNDVCDGNLFKYDQSLN